MRHEYSLSKETKQVLDEVCIKETSEEGGYGDSYLYAVRSGDKTDPFAPLLRMYRAVANASPGSERVWLNKLAAVTQRVNEKLPRSQSPINLLVNSMLDAAVGVQKATSEDLLSNAMRTAVECLSSAVEEIRLTINEADEVRLEEQRKSHGAGHGLSGGFQRQRA